MSAIHVTKDNFESEVLKSEKPVLVDFWAEWCGPCQMLLPIVEGLADELSDVKVVKVNVDEQQELAAEYQVMTIPTLKVFRKGEVEKTQVGVISKNAIMKLLEE